MAPLVKVLIHLLPSLPSTPSLSKQTTSLPHHQPSLDCNLQHPITPPLSNNAQPRLLADFTTTLSSISWSPNRLDVFGLTANNLTHKYWDGYQWGPTASTLETLGNGLASPPVALTWGPNRLDVFGLDDHNVIKHQYYDGTAWQPSASELENLGGECRAHYPISAVTWGEGRLDVFCTGPDRALMHQYFDGSQWQPATGSLEYLGGGLTSGPSAVSWGRDRLDVFAVEYTGYLVHLYWDGSGWSSWERFSGPQFYDAPTVTSWGENRLDIYGVGVDNTLYHKYWDGSQWSEWEDLGGSLQGSVGASSWSANRIDIVGLGTDGAYFYKYYNGESWQPDVKGWYPKGGSFKSSPSLVSWEENRLDIFGVGSVDEALTHQTWYGTGWYPGSTEWETLGGPLAVTQAKASAKERPPIDELRK
ncbi:MAG: hypothetical protein Q9217_000442 [Psora testacea]